MIIIHGVRCVCRVAYITDKKRLGMWVDAPALAGTETGKCF